MQLIVLGMHRSGTSVLARLLNLMGAYFGPEGISTGANDENPKGFWERRDVRMLNDSVLHAVGCDWNRVLGFDSANLPKSVVADFDQSASKLVLEMDAHRPWLLKEPRLCLLLPLWRRVLEVPVCIQIYRNPVEVAASLHTRNKIPMKAGLALWEKYVRSGINGSSGLPTLVVLHRQLMLEPVNVAAQILEQLRGVGVAGLRMPSEREITGFIRNDLYRERESRDDLATYSNAAQVALFRSLIAADEVRAKVDASLTSGSKKALAGYESGLPPLKPESSLNVVPQSELLLRAKLELRDQEVRLVREMSSKLESELKQRDGRHAFLETELRIAHESATRLENELGSVNERLSASAKALLSMSEQAAKKDDELNLRDERIAGLEGEAHAAREASARMVAELAQVRSRLLNMQNELRMGLRRADKLTSDLAAAESELKLADAGKLDAERSVAARFREIEQLTIMLINRDHESEEIDVERRSALKKLAEVTHQLQQAEADNSELRSLASAHAVELRHYEGRLSDIEHSLGWKVMAPVRATARLFRSGKRSVSNDLDAIRESGWFDANWYLERNQDVYENGVDPAEHYLNHGAAEGRDPGPEFDTKSYLAANPEVAASKLNPLLHYIRIGESRGRAIKADETK